MTTTLPKLSYIPQVFTLSNGMTLFFKAMPQAPRVALNMYVYGGNRLEIAPGLADMVDDLLLEGTQNRSAEDIAIALDELSLDLDIDTRRDYSIVSTTFLEEDLEPSLALLSELLLQSTMASYEKEKVRLHGELVMDLDSPKSRSHDLLMTELFKNSPYQASHTNILASIPNLTQLDPFQSHYQRTYHPGNIMVTVVGNVSIAQVQALLEQYFPSSQGANQADTNPPSPLLIAQNQYITAAKDDSNQLHVYKAWFAPKAAHPDYPAMVVMNTILGGAGLTSRLFLELRDKQGLAYNVRSQYEASKYLGLFTLYIGTEPNNRDKVLKGFEVECQKLMDIPVSEQELAEAKENVLGRRVVYLETAAQQCAYIGNQLSLGLNPEELDSLPEQVKVVTAQQVQAVSQRYLGQHAIISAVGPSAYL